MGAEATFSLLITSSLCAEKGRFSETVVEFRELSKRTVPERHLLPRVQTTIENLGGNKWSSLLDRGKAYHQGFVNPESQHMTAFVTVVGPVRVGKDPIWSLECPRRISKIYGGLSGTT